MRDPIKVTQCLKYICGRLDDVPPDVDPFPWGTMSPAAEPGDNLTPNIRPMAIRKRADLALFRAMLTGALRAWFVNGTRNEQVPAWGWAEQDGVWRDPNGGYGPWLHPLTAEPWRQWTYCDIHLSRAEFLAWLASDEVLDPQGFPGLPPAHDDAERPALLCYREPPNTPFVSLSHAVSWLACGISIGSDSLFFAFWRATSLAQPFDLARFGHAVESLVEAATGGLPIRGKLIDSGADQSGIDTATIPPERFHDYRRFDIGVDGLLRGTGISLEQHFSPLSWTLPVSSPRVWDVKVERAALMRLRREQRSKRQPRSSKPQTRPAVAELNRWYAALPPETKSLGQVALLSVARLLFAGKRITREDIRALTPGRKRGRRPIARQA